MCVCHSPNDSQVTQIRSPSGIAFFMAAFATVSTRACAFACIVEDLYRSLQSGAKR